MKFKLENIKNFKDTIIASEHMLNEIKFEADKDGIRFRGLDGSHVAFMSMEIDKTYFDEYSIDTPESCIIDTRELVKVFKRSKANDKLIFSFNEEEIKIQFKGEATRTFKLKQVDMDYDSPSMPNIDYPITIDIDYKELKDLVKDAELYDEKLTFATEDQQFKIISGGEFGEYSSTISTLTKVKKASSSFSISWLNRFFKLGNVSDEVTVNMGSDMPLLLCFNDEDGLKVEFLLAPRIEQD